MAAFTVGYLVGSLATRSINRRLARALVEVAPPELQMAEISFKDLPLYGYDYDANNWRSSDTRTSMTRESVRITSPADSGRVIGPSHEHGSADGRLKQQ
jgi:NAD(P)H-dependent FMN reductase